MKWVSQVVGFAGIGNGTGEIREISGVVTRVVRTGPDSPFAEQKKPHSRQASHMICYLPLQARPMTAKRKESRRKMTADLLYENWREDLVMSPSKLFHKTRVHSYDCGY